MIHPIAAAADSDPHKVLLRTDQADWTAIELRDAVQARAGALLSAGLKAGDPIGLVGPGNADWLIALHAIGWIGGVATPLSHTAPPGPALAAARPLAVLAPEGASVPHEQVLDLRQDGPAQREPWTPTADASCLCLTTSGTTGTPRAVTLSWAQLAASADASAAHLGMHSDDVWLGCLPLHHIGGLSVFLRTARAGTTAVLHSRFDPHEVSSALQSGTITQVSLVPAMLREILDARQETPFHPRLRLMLIGGAPMPSDLLARARALRLPLALTWGMTEAASQIATREPGDLRAAPDLGHPLPGLKVHTEEGFLVVTGPTVPGGCWKTSDRGAIDAEGRVIVYGRGADLIISGGENIDPREVERALEAHPDIAEAAVVGRPDTRWGQRPIAFLVASGTVQPDLDPIKQHLAGTLPSFKHPESYTWTAKLPRGPLGKLRRSALID